MLGHASAGASCISMSDWMTKHLSDGRLTGSMMWGSATALRSTCGQWMTTETSGTADGNAWCDQMVTWMTQHVGNWDQWMMSSHMMGQ